MGFCSSREKKQQVPTTSTIISAGPINKATILDDVQRYFQFKFVLGHGQFGTVREAVRIGSDNNRVAIKSIRKDSAPHNLLQLKRELAILRSLDHPNVIQHFEAYEDAKYLHLVMELCEGGDLFDYVISHEHLTEEEVSSIMRKLLHAVNYMHGMSICHRDLKPENFLFTTKAQNADIKIVDFGVSTGFADGDLLNSVVGTPYYIAPEVINGSYSKECDIWSLGVVMYFLLAGEDPFFSDNLAEIYRKIAKGEFSFEGETWRAVSEPAKELISEMLITDPKRRISLEKALKHPWFDDRKVLSPREIPHRVLESLRHYKVPRRLQKEVIHLIIKYMSTSEISDLKSAFLAIDREKTGFITANDLEKAIINAGIAISSEEMGRIIGNVRLVGNGKIKYSDFLVAAFDRKQLMDEELLYLAFKRFDVDNNGLISQKDMEIALINLGSELTTEELEQAISSSSLQNVQLTFDDFKAIVQEKDEPEVISSPYQRIRQKSMKLTFSMVASAYSCP